MNAMTDRPQPNVFEARGSRYDSAVDPAKGAGNPVYRGVVMLGRAARSVIDAMTWGMRAKRVFAGLEQMSDEALAERGLARADVSRHLVEIMIGQPVRKRHV